MAKQKKDQAVDESEGAPPEGTPPDAGEEKELTAAQKKSLFEEYDEKNKSYARAEEELELAKKQRSDAVRAILEGTGRTGPFGWKGKQLTIVRRGEIFYFKSQEAKVDEIG